MRIRPAILPSLALALACLGPVALAAQPAASGTIEVSAAAPAIEPAPTAGRSTIDAAQIEASGVSSLAEAVALAPGVALSVSGGAGAQAAVSIRGSTTNQVLVLVDGVPVSDPSTGAVDFSRLGLSPGDVESVEVLRGGASSQYGPDAVGGVVIITTKKAKPGLARPLLELSLSNVSRPPFASVSGYGLGASRVGADPLALLDGQALAVRLGLPGGLVLSGGLDRAANAYLYHDTSGERRARLNAGLLGGRASLAWSGSLGGGLLAASLDGDARELGVPGSITAPTPEALERDRNARASLSWSTDSFLSDRVAFEGRSYGILKDVRYRETLAAAEDESLASRAGLETRWSILAIPGLDLGAGLAARYERLDSSNVTTGSGGAPERLGLGAYVEPDFSLGPWRLVPAARFDWTSDFDSGFSFSLGLARSLGEGLELSLNASTAYRAPSFDDLYWPAQAGVAGNPSLMPESSLGGDVGLDLKAGGASLSISAFARYVKDVILWQAGGDGIWRPSNWGVALYPGFEASLRAGLGGFDLSLSASLIHSFALSGSLGLLDDRRVPMVPEAAFVLALSRDFGAFFAGISLDYAGLRYTGIDNRDYLPARLVVDLHLSLRQTRNLKLAVDVANLLDERYESVQGYPMPGFSLKATASLKIGPEA